jgi:hypothetical protein
MEWNTRKGFQRGTMPKVTKKVSLLGGTEARITECVHGVDWNNHRPFGKALLTIVSLSSFLIRSLLSFGL